MKYKIGQKVETEQGLIAEVISVETWGTIKVMGNGFMMETIAEKLKPYKTPHERLLEMGYVKKINKNTVDYIKETKDTYRRYGNRITIHTKEKLYSGIAFNDDLFNSQYHKSEMAFTLELSHILTQYLEELNEK